MAASHCDFGQVLLWNIVNLGVCDCVNKTIVELFLLQEGVMWS